MSPRPLRIAVDGVSQAFEEQRLVLNQVSFSVREGEVVAIVGRSGGGKTSLLRIIAGLDTPISGSCELSPADCRIGYVFQEGGVFPWMRVWRNLSYSHRISGASIQTQRRVAADLAEAMGLEAGLLERYPGELSGGERRRVGIAMMLGYEPSILLLDEPSAHLDFVTQLELDGALQRAWSEANLTGVLVTHSLDEAIFLADRLLLLEKGKILCEVKVGEPRPRETLFLTSQVFLEIRQRVVSALDGR